MVIRGRRARTRRDGPRRATIPKRAAAAAGVERLRVGIRAFARSLGSTGGPNGRIHVEWQRIKYTVRS